MFPKSIFNCSGKISKALPFAIHGPEFMHLNLREYSALKTSFGDLSHESQPSDIDARV